jgi:lactoylglutathione lyase
MSAVNHVGLCVADLGRARRFYEEGLGFSFVRELRVPDRPSDRLLQISPPLGMTAVYLRLGDFVLELIHYQRAGNPAGRVRPMNEPGLTHLSLTVDDLGEACRRVVATGGEVLAETDVGAAVFVRDPDGQLVELLRPGALG